MLKKCPFCGANARYVSLYDDFIKIECMLCGGSTPIIQATIEKSVNEVKDELKELWNRRI